MRAARFRRTQALVVLALSTLVTASLVFAPMFARAIARASLSTRLAGSATDAALRLTSWSPSEPRLVRSPRQLAALVPADLRAHHGVPVLGQFVMVTGPGADQPTPLAWLSTGCDTVEVVQGRCPTGTGEVLAPVTGGSSTDPWTAGATFTLTESDDAASGGAASGNGIPEARVTVVGTYRPRAGVTTDLGLGTRPGTPAPLLGAVLEESWREPHSLAVLPLRPGTVTLDDIADLGAATRAFVARPWAATASTPAEQQATLPVYAASGIPAIADAVATDRRQADVTVPVLTVQLAVLLAVVLWLVLLAASEQRRTEVAVAKLRGRGAAGSRRLLLQETLPPVVLGLPLGAGLAVALSYAGRRVVLPVDVPLEVPVPAWLVLGASAVVLVGLTLLSVHRVSEEPVAGLLRSVPSRGRGATLGLLEAMVVAASLAVFVALATGSLAGPAALAAPTLLAVAVGILGSRLLPAALGGTGTWLLSRGRTVPGAALLQASRRPATRWLVPVVTVGLSLVVFATNALAVGDRNRSDRAGVEVGAAAVLTVAPADGRAVAAAVTAVDPGGRHLTPVALVTPPSASAPSTLAVVPDRFARIAAWPGADRGALPWSRLRGTAPEPIRLTGDRLLAAVTSTGAAELGDSGRPRDGAVMTVALQLVTPEGIDRTIALARLGASPRAQQVIVPIPCVETCTVRGIAFASAVGVPLGDTVTLSGVSTDRHGVGLGSASQWRAGAGPNGATSVQAVPDGLRMRVTTAGGPDLVVESAGLPESVPALVTPALAASTDPASTAQFVDGSTLLVSAAGRVPYAPGARASTFVVDLDTLLLQRWRGTGDAVLEVYSDRADPAYLRSVADRLARQGIHVVDTRTQAALEERYAESAAAWSLRLALVVGILAVLVVALALIVLVESSARERSRDYAGLRLAGLGARSVRRVAVGELLPVVVVASILGLGAGALATHAAMPRIPLFPTGSAVYPVDLTLAWWAVGAAAVVALAALGATAVLAAARVSARSGPDRLREAG